MINSSKKKKKSTQYANIDMDKFKFDFNLFVPSANKPNIRKDKSFVQQ